MIRKVYLDMVHRKLADGDLIWLARAAARYPLVRLSNSLNRPLCGPILTSLIVTYRCTYGCSMCVIPDRGHRGKDDQAQEFDTGKMVAIINELSDLGVLGIGFTGGEPMLREDISDLLRHAVGTGMLTHLNTNGSLVTPEMAENLVATGAHSINISIDGTSSTTHDRIRGVEGAWDNAVRAVKELVQARFGDSRPRIKVVMVVMEENMAEVPGMVDLANDAGADCLEFVPVQPFRTNTGCGDQTGSTELAESAVKVLSEAIERAEGLIKIENSPRMVALFGPAFQGEPSPLECYAGYNSIAVDCYGKVFPCHPWASWSRPVHDLSESSLEEFWSSREYHEKRQKIAACRECTLNGQAELNLLFQPFLRIRK